MADAEEPQSENVKVGEHKHISSWRDIVDAAHDLASRDWVFRGHQRSEWSLATSLEREFGTSRADLERELYWRFVRLAPRWLPAHLIPAETDAAAWLGLIQHYGGPTRLLDVTRSFYVALFFAMELPGDNNRALWAIDPTWCSAACEKIMADTEGRPMDPQCRRTLSLQAQMVSSLVLKASSNHFLFERFKPFTGVFPLDPWKPETRQSAQQGQFLCVANPSLTFVQNLSAHARPPEPVFYRFILPASLRLEVLEHLAMMNVTAETLFPDLGGLARSLRTVPLRRSRTADIPRETV
jgi:hypothetical protein